MNKKQSRLKRARRFRAVNRRVETPRLVIYRSLSHIYAQLIVRVGNESRVLTSASTLDKGIKTQLNGDKKSQAKIVGAAIAERAKQKGIEKVAFDRSGFRYHGRVKALADGAREGGLVF